MAKDDYYVVVYEILSYLYQCLKKGKSADVSKLTSESLFQINEKYRAYIIRHMRDDGLVEGVVEKNYINGESYFILENIQITPAGIGYLLDNNFIKKAARFMKDVKEIMPFSIGV